MLTLAQVTEILNVGMPALRTLLSSGELRGVQLGGRHYLARLLGLLRFFPGMTGEERHRQRMVSARFVRIGGRRRAAFMVEGQLPTPPRPCP